MSTLDLVAIERLTAAIAAGPALSLAMLFGSGARQGLRADSDIDVAILPTDPTLPLAAELRLQADLARASGRTVDLVRLDLASTLVRWQVARYGTTLFEGVPFAASRFIASAVSDYLDFAPALTHAGERFRQRLARNGKLA